MTQANADLEAANERERQRFDLAMEAIKLFHGEVSEDLLLKEKQFEDLRTKLLRGAADFYGKLEGLLEGQTDRPSRAALGRAYFELGELTDKIGNKPEALAVHRKGLAVRRELAEPAGGRRRGGARRGAEPVRRGGGAASRPAISPGAWRRGRRHSAWPRAWSPRAGGPTRPGSSWPAAMSTCRGMRSGDTIRTKGSRWPVAPR